MRQGEQTQPETFPKCQPRLYITAPFCSLHVCKGVSWTDLEQNPGVIARRGRRWAWSITFISAVKCPCTSCLALSGGILPPGSPVVSCSAIQWLDASMRTAWTRLIKQMALVQSGVLATVPWEAAEAWDGSICCSGLSQELCVVWALCYVISCACQI